MESVIYPLNDQGQNSESLTAHEKITILIAQYAAGRIKLSNRRQFRQRTLGNTSKNETIKVQL